MIIYLLYLSSILMALIGANILSNSLNKAKNGFNYLGSNSVNMVDDLLSKKLI